LMALAVSSTLAVALVNLASDLLLKELHPRISQALAFKREALE